MWICLLILSYLSRSLADCWGTTVDLTTSFLHSSRFLSFRSMVFHSRPVHSLMLSFHVKGDKYKSLQTGNLISCPPIALQPFLDLQQAWVTAYIFVDVCKQTDENKLVDHVGIVEVDTVSGALCCDKMNRHADTVRWCEAGLMVSFKFTAYSHRHTHTHTRSNTQPLPSGV